MFVMNSMIGCQAHIYHPSSSMVSHFRTNQSPSETTLAHWAALISISIALSRTPAYTVTTDMGLVHRMVRLLTSQPKLALIHRP